MIQWNWYNIIYMIFYWKNLFGMEIQQKTYKKKHSDTPPALLIYTIINNWKNPKHLINNKQIRVGIRWYDYDVMSVHL